MLDERTLQQWLKELGYFTGAVDGVSGEPFKQAIAEMELATGLDINTWNDERRHMAAEQLFLRDHGFSTDIDGLYGPATQRAHNDYISKDRDVDQPEEEVAHLPTMWPRQKDVPAFYGEMGKNQELIVPPYQLWYGKIPVEHISVHQRVAPSVLRVLVNVLSLYGDQVKLLGLDQYSGSLNVRKMRGGNSWSMHSWGIAIDFDAPHNELNWDHTRARFAKPEYRRFFDCWYAEGWISLGRERDYDWMHIQAARL